MTIKKAPRTKLTTKKRPTSAAKVKAVTSASRVKVSGAKKRPAVAAKRTKVTTTKKRQLVAQKPIHKRFLNAFAVFSLLVFGAIGVIGVVTSTLSHAAGTASSTGQIVGIANKCLDNSGQGTANGNKIQLWGCNNTVAQLWTLTGDGTLQVQGRCLDVKGASKAERTLVQLYKCNSTVAQQWTVNTTTHTIINPHSGLCLDDQWAHTDNGNPIWMYHCNGTDAQKWTTPTVATTPTPKPTPAPTPKPTPSPTPSPSTSSTIAFGVSTHAAGDLNGFDAAAGKRPSIVMWYADFAHYPNYPANLAHDATARGQKLYLTWEPHDWNGGIQSQYSLSKIYGGTYDALITRWAQQIKADGTPIYLRFAHEQNGYWYSWGQNINGNKAGDYVKAWNHVRDIFRKVGTTNVTWIWSPNVGYMSNIKDLWPGDANVDIMALDGYNKGSALGAPWVSFDAKFKSSFQTLHAISNKPIWIGEMGSGEAGGSKAQWITDMFKVLPDYQKNYNLQEITWFDHNKETDWRIESSASAQAAFAKGISSPLYK